MAAWVRGPRPPCPACPGTGRGSLHPGVLCGGAGPQRLYGSLEGSLAQQLVHLSAVVSAAARLFSRFGPFI
jgi:hypothetical protein